MKVKSEKNQSCSKLPKIATKFVKLDFRVLAPPPKKMGGPKKMYVKWRRRKKMFQIGENWVRKYFRIFWHHQQQNSEKINSNLFQIDPKGGKIGQQ